MALRAWLGAGRPPRIHQLSLSRAVAWPASFRTSLNCVNRLTWVVSRRVISIPLARIWRCSDPLGRSARTLAIASSKRSNIRISEPFRTVKETPSEITYYRNTREMIADRKNPEEMVEKISRQALTAEEAAPDSIVIDASLPVEFEILNPVRALQGYSVIVA